MAIGSLIERAGVGLFNRASEALTGQPTPGSSADIQQQLEKTRLRQQLRQAQQPPQRRTFQELLADYEALNGLQDRAQDRANQTTLSYMGAPSVLDARERMTQQNIDAYNAQARNQRDLLTTEGQVRQGLLERGAQASLATLNPVLANQLDLATIDSRDLDKYLAYGQAQTQQILEAQKNAQTMNMFGRLLGGIAMAAGAFA